MWFGLARRHATLPSDALTVSPSLSPSQRYRSKRLQALQEKDGAVPDSVKRARELRQVTTAAARGAPHLRVAPG